MNLFWPIYLAPRWLTIVITARVPRLFRERLFSSPWRPWQAMHIVTRTHSLLASPGPILLSKTHYPAQLRAEGRLN
jgi:hypothetical protein